jgi:hypothetical protein
MPPYLPGYSDLQFPPPYSFKGVTIWSFPLAADIQKLTGIVDLYLNLDPSGTVRFRPLAPLVYMMVLHYDRMIPEAPPFKDWGYLTQNEFYFAIPIVRLENGLPVDAGLFTPYIFVDNPWSMICGNTVLGFPKQMAWFLLPPGLKAYPIQIDAPVFVTKSPDTPLTWQRLATIQSGGFGGLLEETGDLLTDAGEILEGEASLWPFGHIEKLFGAGGLALEGETLDLLRNIRDNKLYSLVQLKQIHNAVGIADSCYTAIVNLSVGLSSVPLSLLLPPASIDLKSYATATYGEDLGLRYTNGRLIPIMPYRTRCDFSIKDPKILYSAGS